MRSLTVLLTAFVSMACSHTPTAPIPRADKVDINRFMGQMVCDSQYPYLY